MWLFTREDVTGGTGDEPVRLWRKSSRSLANGNCVEVTDLSGDFIGLRDGKNPSGPIIGFTPAEWDSFVEGVRSGEFDRR